MSRGSASVMVPLIALLLAACGDADRGQASALLERERDELVAIIDDDPEAHGARAELVDIQLRLRNGVGAEAAVREALAAGGNAAILRPKLAHAYALQGDSRRALATLEAGPIAPQAVGKAAWVAANVHLDNGNLGEARLAFDRALLELPHNATLWIDVARFRSASADNLGARAAIDHAIKLDKRSSAALGYKANLVRKQDGLPAALRWYAAALEVDPGNASALIDQAATLGDMGHYREMLASLRRAAVLNPGDPRPYYYQAVLAARAGNYRLARSLLQRTRGQMDDVPGFMLVSAATELALGGEAVAATWAERLLSRSQHNFPARKILAAANWADGDSGRAAEVLDAIVARPDADSWSLHLAARVAAENGRMAESSRYQQRAAALAGGDGVPFGTSESHGLLAAAADAEPLNPARVIPAIAAEIILGEHGRAQRRAIYLRDANRGVAKAHMLLGDAALAGGDYALAIEAFRDARALDAHEGASLRLAYSLYRSGDQPGFAAAVQALRQAQPSSIAAERLAGHLALDARNWDLAIMHFERVRRRVGNRDVVILRELARAWAAKGDMARAIGFIALAYRLQPLNAEIMRIYAQFLEQQGNSGASNDLREKASQIGR